MPQLVLAIGRRLVSTASLDEMTKLVDEPFQPCSIQTHPWRGQRQGQQGALNKGKNCV